MLGKLIESVVGTGGDIARRYQEGKITLAEAEKELAVLGLSLEQKVIEGQTSLNMKDAESADPVRTRWRPIGAIVFTAICALAYALLVLDGVEVFGAVPVKLAEAKAASLGERAAELLVFVASIFGIRETGKAFGNR